MQSPSAAEKPTPEIRQFPGRRRVSEASYPAAGDRSARVQALKDAIANGTYAPDPEEVARKLLDSGL